LRLAYPELLRVFERRKVAQNCIKLQSWVPLEISHVPAPGSISSMFYEQLLHAKVPKAPKKTVKLSVFYAFAICAQKSCSYSWWSWIQIGNLCCSRFDFHFPINDETFDTRKKYLQCWKALKKHYVLDNESSRRFFLLLFLVLL